MLVFTEKKSEIPTITKRETITIVMTHFGIRLDLNTELFERPLESPFEGVLLLVPLFLFSF